MVPKIRTIAYLIATLGLAVWQGLIATWFFYVLWGFLMACWEQPTHHWARSRFRKWGWDQKFWDNTESWKYAKRMGSYKLDSFHISKTLSICLMGFVPLSTNNWTWYYALSAAWLTTESFNLFYNYVLQTTKTTTDDTNRS